MMPTMEVLDLASSRFILPQPYALLQVIPGPQRAGVTPRRETVPTGIPRFHLDRHRRLFPAPCSSSGAASSHSRCLRPRWAAPPPPPSSPPRASPIRVATGPALCCGHGVPRFVRTTSRDLVTLRKVVDYVMQHYEMYHYSI